MEIQDRGPQVLAVAILFSALCWISVVLRVYVRGWMLRSMGVDDNIMLITLAIFSIYLGCQIKAESHGTGKHASDISERNRIEGIKWWFICELLYVPCTCLLKISVGFFLLRIAIHRLHIWILRIIMAGTVVIGLSYFLMVSFQCVPISAMWNISPRAPGHCWNDQIVLGLTYMASIINCLADWALGLLPILIVQTLKFNRKKKIIVGCILSFAAIGSIATIVRSIFIPTLLDGDDFPYQTTDVAIWSTVEVGIGITAASIATLRPLLQLIALKTGLSKRGPQAQAWQLRQYRYKRSNSGYVKAQDPSPTPQLARKETRSNLTSRRERSQRDMSIPGTETDFSTSTTASGSGDPIARSKSIPELKRAPSTIQKTVEITMSTETEGERATRPLESIPDIEHVKTPEPALPALKKQSVFMADWEPDLEKGLPPLPRASMESQEGITALPRVEKKSRWK